LTEVKLKTPKVEHQSKKTKICKMNSKIQDKLRFLSRLGDCRLNLVNRIDIILK